MRQVRIYSIYLTFTMVLEIKIDVFEELKWVLFYIRGVFSLFPFKSQFPHSVMPHESAFVNISIYPINVSFRGILPHSYVAPIRERRLILSVLSNHEWVSIDKSREIMIVEISPGINDRFLSVSLLD